MVAMAISIPLPSGRSLEVEGQEDKSWVELLVRTAWSGYEDEAPQFEEQLARALYWVGMMG